MSHAPATLPPTTYSTLTRSASTHLAAALVAADTQPIEQRALPESLAAHRHLTAMLGHLGTVLASRAWSRSSRAAARRSGPMGADAALAARLTELGHLDWELVAGQRGTVADRLHRAAREIGAAADLWATHRDPKGEPRSIEASRMRHPATLGAASREWRELVVVAGAVADVLGGASSGAQDDRLTASLADFPTPRLRQDEPRGPVTIAVARPTRHRPTEPLAAIDEGVAHLRATAWRLERAGTAPVPILANLAAIGIMLSHEAARASEHAAAIPGAIDADGHRAAGRGARRAEAAWRDVAGLVDSLRSAHPARTSIQVERLDLRRLLDGVAAAGDERIGAVATALVDAALTFDEVAGLLAKAVRSAQASGELHVVGRAIPNEAIARRPDLLEAKLLGRPVPAPMVVVRRLEEALRTVTTPRAERVPDSEPAA